MSVRFGEVAAASLNTTLRVFVLVIFVLSEVTEFDRAEADTGFDHTLRNQNGEDVTGGVLLEHIARGNDCRVVLVNTTWERVVVAVVTREDDLEEVEC